MALSAREAKHLATTANSLEKIVRLLEAQHRNTMEIHRVLTEISAKLPTPVVKDASQLEIPKVVADPGMRYNDKYQPDDLGRLKPNEWRHNLGMDTFFDLHSPHENDLMTEEDFRIYDAGL